MFEYMQFNISPWGWELAVYFFLVGMASMSFAMVAAPNVIGGAMSVFEPLQRSTSMLVLVLLAICSVLLIMDLGQPSRFLYPLIYFHASSPLSWGSLFFVLFGICVVGFLSAQIMGKSSLLKPLGLAGTVLAVLLPLYTGWDLMAQQARELWHSPAIPLLFVVLSISSAAALVSLLAMVQGKQNENLTTLIRNILICSLLVTLILFVAEWLRISYGTAEEMQALALINSELSTRFWVITLIVGILAPLGMLLMGPSTPIMVTGAAVLSAVGAYTFRDVIIVAGQLPMSFY